MEQRNTTVKPYKTIQMYFALEAGPETGVGINTETVIDYHQMALTIRLMYYHHHKRVVTAIIPGRKMQLPDNRETKENSIPIRLPEAATLILFILYRWCTMFSCT